MPSSIPDVSLPNQRNMRSIRAVDHTGDTFSEVLEYVDETKVAVAANVNAFMTAMGAASQASFYEYVVQVFFAAVKEASLAGDLDRSEVQNRITILCKDPAGRRSSLVIPAPVPAMFQADTDIPDTSAGVFGDVVTAFLGLLEDGFTAVSAKYTTGKQNNESVPV
jgi:hypothetical protein